MDEGAGFEARAVLAPKRSLLARLVILLPAVALVAIAWAGLSGTRSQDAVADPAQSPAPISPSPRPQPPAEVLGLQVHRLDDIRLTGLGRDDVVAVAGWYMATAINDCPTLAALYREGSLPDVRGDTDALAFCERSGMLYASRPDGDGSFPASAPGPSPSASHAPSAVGVTLVVGVIVPPELEVIGADATEVVVVARFVETGEGCRVPYGCGPELVVDHVAWTGGS